MSIPAILGLATGIVLVAIFILSIRSSFFFVPDSAPSIIPKGVDAKVIPKDFDVVYSTDKVQIAPVLDTKNGLFVKDMVCDPDIQVKMVLSDSELERIWHSVIENDFFKIPSDLSDRCQLYGNNCLVTDPSYRAVLNLTAYGQSHAVKYDSSSISPNDEYVQHY